MRVLGVNGYLASSGRFPDSLWIQRRCRDQMMVLKLKQTRKDEDVKRVRGHHLQCVLGQTLTLEVSAGHFLLCYLSWRTSESVWQLWIRGSKLCDRTSWLFGWVHGGGTLSLTYFGHEKRKRCWQKQFQRICTWKEWFLMMKRKRNPYLCICFLSSPFMSSSHPLKRQKCKSSLGKKVLLYTPEMCKKLTP